jgi:prepilin-type N-terminal cleavage/methylation domain-containing protein
MSTLKTENFHEKHENKNLKKQRGFTLIEFLAVIALGAILIGGVFIAINNAMTTTKTKSLSDDIVSIGTSVMGSSAGTGTYGTGTSLDEYLIRTGKVPGSLTISGTAPNRVLNHPFESTVEVTGRGNKFVVTLNDIPGNVCMDLFTNAAAWERVLVSDTAPASINVNTGGYTPPYSQIDATAACSETNPNRMHFIN